MRQSYGDLGGPYGDCDSNTSETGWCDRGGLLEFWLVQGSDQERGVGGWEAHVGAGGLSSAKVRGLNSCSGSSLHQVAPPLSLGMVAENDTCEKCSRILMVVKQINCGAPAQVAMNVFVHNTITIVMCTAHDIIWLFYYSTFKCKNIFTFHIFGFALSMLRHGRESGKQ